MAESALAIERRLAGQEWKLRGRLRISSADRFGAHVLAPIIAHCTEAFPWPRGDWNRKVRRIPRGRLGASEFVVAHSLR